MDSRRPLERVTREQLRVWMRLNRTWVKWWDQLEPVLGSVNRRGVTKWVFALGFIAGQMSVRQQLEAAPLAVEKAVEKAMLPVQKELEQLAHLGRIE